MSSSFSTSLSSTPSPTEVLEKIQHILSVLECPICLSVTEDAHIIPECGHRFCGDCIKESFRKCKNECPSCRAHVSTRRALRADEIFDNLIQKLSCIISESSSTNLNEKNEIESILHSLKALQWHFQCPLCSNELEQTHISTECLHRFCKECLLNKQATTMKVSLTSCVVAYDNNHCILTKCPFCIETTEKNTKFIPDKQYESINRAIRFIINSLDSLNNAGDQDIVIKMEELDAIIKMEDEDLAIMNGSYFQYDYHDAVPDEVTSGYHGFTGVESEINDDENNSIHSVKEKPVSEDIETPQIVKAVVKTSPLEEQKESTSVEETKNRSNQKYRIGSRFIKNESQEYGRIVGFNGDIYQVFFPHDKSCHSYKECDFNAVKFIKTQRRPAKTIKPKKHPERSSDKVLRCPRCQRRFSSNPNDDVSGRAPVQSQNCAHVVCVDCVQSIRMDSSFKNDNANSNRKLRTTVDCPFCKKSKSFNAIDPTVCVAMCNMVKLYEEMERQRKQNKIRDKIIGESTSKTIDKKEKKRHSSSVRERYTPEQETKLKRHRKESRKGSYHETKKAEKGKELDTLIRCKSCKKDKILDKFSSKQVEKFKQLSESLCRRCEEKVLVQMQLGSGANKVSTTVEVAKKHGTKPKFLTTIVPWNGSMFEDNRSLPPNLIVDGYTRDSWGLLNNDDEQQEQCWLKTCFWSTGNSMTNFLDFLKERKKSAYGTFLLPDKKTDGFFVIPYDQSIETGSTIFIGKYIIGLGLLEDPKSNTNTTNDLNFSEFQDSSSTLKKLLVAEFKSSQNLSIIPQGSVKVAQKISTRPEGPSSPRGTANWFRQRVVIEDADTDDEDNVAAVEDNKNTQMAESV